MPATRQAASALVFGLTKTSSCPSSTVASRVMRAPCGCTTSVRAASCNGTSLGELPQTMTGSSRWDLWFLAMRFPCSCGLSVLASRDDPEGTFGTRSSRTGISGRDSVLAIIQPFTDLGLRRWNGGTSVIPPGVWVSLDTPEPSPFDGSFDGPSSPVVAPQERNTAL